MSDIDSAFVEIAAREPEMTVVAERLVPLYEDPVDVPASESPLAAARGVVNGCAIVLLIALCVGIAFACVAAGVA